MPGEEEEEAAGPETVTVGAGTLRFLRQGEGDPVVLLHGFGGDLNNWLFVTPALAAEHAVYALDLPGPRRLARRTSARATWTRSRPPSSSSWSRSRSGACTSSATRSAGWWPPRWRGAGARGR